MITEKEKYTLIVRNWLEKFLKEKYSKTNNIEIITLKSNISKSTNNFIRKIINYSLMDFSPDMIGILESKTKKDIKIILLNRSIAPISVKEIGEMNLYSKLINSEMSFIVSSKGLPNEVNSLLLNDSIESSLLNYGNDRSIIILRLTDEGIIDKKTIFSRKFKNLF